MSNFSKTQCYVIAKRTGVPADAIAGRPVVWTFASVLTKNDQVQYIRNNPTVWTLVDHGPCRHDPTK